MNVRSGRNSILISLIGRKIEVIYHSNESLIGVKGIVIFESENLIHVRKEDGSIIKVPKKYVTLKVFYNGDEDYKIFSYDDIKNSVVRRLSKL